MKEQTLLNLLLTVREAMKCKLKVLTDSVSGEETLFSTDGAILLGLYIIVKTRECSVARFNCFF